MKKLLLLTAVFMSLNSFDKTVADWKKERISVMSPETRQLISLWLKKKATNTLHLVPGDIDLTGYVITSEIESIADNYYEIERKVLYCLLWKVIQ